MLWELCNQIICFFNKNRQYKFRYCSNIHVIIIFLYSFILIAIFMTLMLFTIINKWYFCNY